MNLPDGQYSRNYGLHPLGQANVLEGKTLAIAGTGGVGGNVAVKFAHEHQVGHIKLADFDIYDESNRNRQIGATETTIGWPKVRVIEEMVHDRAGHTKIEVFDDGVQPDNLDAFLSGADVVLDAIDFGAPEMHLQLAQRARELGIPVVFGVEIAYGARAVWFDPAGRTFEDFIGHKPGQKKLDLKYMIGWVPPYVDVRALRMVQTEEIPAPALGTGGSCVEAALVPLLAALLSGMDVPPPATMQYIDTHPRKFRSGTVRHQSWTYTSSLLVAAVRTYAGINRPTV